jgi:D-amino-acid dehydrogenase
LPIVGRPRTYENLVVATGHAALGFTLAPLTGRLVAQLVGNRRLDHDIAPLHPDRF